MIVMIDEDLDSITRVPIRPIFTFLLDKLANLGMPRPVNLRPQSVHKVADTFKIQPFPVYLGFM